MPSPQKAMFAQGYRCHEHLELDLAPGATLGDVLAAFARLRRRQLAVESLVGFGARLWRLLAPHAVPPQLRELEPLQTAAGTLPVRQHDMWLWLQERGPDLVLDAARAALGELAPALVVAEDQVGFAYRDGRDLTGFVDGTANPLPADAPGVALVAAGPGAGGSFALVQRWRHDLARFHALPLATQEAIIGRTRADSVELSDAPPTSHVARMTVVDHGGELQIWRRSVPWGNARENGLQFIGFSADPRRFATLLGRMYGQADGVADALLQVSKPETGALYFAPSADDLAPWVVE